MKTLHNPTDLSIENYRIEEGEMGADGDIIRTTDGSYKKTGNTLEWSLGPGQTMEFPAYVADYLKEVHGFLDLKKDKVTTVSNGGSTTPSVSTPAPEGSVCQHCGKTYKNTRGLALHIAAKHPEKL